MKQECNDWNNKFPLARSQHIRKGDILNYLKKSKHLWMIPLYGIFYMVSFMLVERSDVKIHIIHSLADDKIPFCPYFIIPYVMWYFFWSVQWFISCCSARARRNIISILAPWQWEWPCSFWFPMFTRTDRIFVRIWPGRAVFLFQRSDFCIRSTRLRIFFQASMYSTLWQAA